MGYSARRVLAGSLMLVLVGALALVAVADLPPGGTFVDDDGNVHEANIEAIFAEGITKGCNPPTRDRYCPEDPVTRAQMASFLTRMLSLSDTPLDAFIDDGDSVHHGDINRLAAARITRGCNPPTNDRYCPGDSVTRAQMASFLVRALNLGPANTDHFIDDGSSVHQEDINRLAEAGITRGCNPPSNDRYCPGDPVLRDQMASFLGRALGLTPIQPPPPTSTPPGQTTITQPPTTTTTVAVSDELLMSTSPDRSNPRPFGGKLSGNIYAFVNPAGSIRQVEFHLDDPSASGSPFQIESEAPYDMGATISKEEGAPFNSARLTNGAHKITVEIIRNGGPTSVETYPISVSNPRSLVFHPIALNLVASTGASQTRQVEVGTNNGTSTNFTVAPHGADWLDVSPTSGSTGANLTIKVDAAGLSPGVKQATVNIFSAGYRAGELPIRLVVRD